MEFFTIGNLLAVLVSAGIVVVYRILDRNNRALDKVRKYAQSAQKELDAFLDARVQGLKDFSVELQVHEATGKQIIQRVKTAEEGLEAKAAHIESLTKRVESLSAGISNLEAMSVKVDENLGRLKEESEFVDKVGRRLKAAVEQMQAIEADIPTSVERFSQKNSEALQPILEKFRQHTVQEKAKVDQAAHETQIRVDQFQKFLQGIEAKKQAFVNEAQAALQETVHKAHEKAAASVKSLEKDWQNAEKVFADTLKTHAASVQKLADDTLGKAVAEVRDRTQKTEAQVTDALAAMEGRLTEFENDFHYKANKLEEVSTDMDRLEGNLRSQMDRASEAIKLDWREKMDALRQEALAVQTAQRERAAALEAGMEALEGELEDLKGKAYENVSEKLQVFEDEFFVDLQRRDAAMTQSFEELQKKIVDRMTLSDQEISRALESSTKNWQDRLKENFAALQANNSDQVKKIEASLIAWQEKINVQVDTAQALLDKTSQSFAADLARNTEDFQRRVENETSRREIALKETLTKVERELDLRVKQISDLVESGKTDLVNRIETTRSDIGVWQSRLAAQFKDAQNEVSEHHQTFRTFIQERIGNLKEEFTRQRDDLVFATQEERSLLKREIKDLQDHLSELAIAIQSKADSALDSSRKDYDTFLLEFQRRVRELQTDQEVFVKDFRAALVDAKDKSEALQKKLFGRVEDQYNLLVVHLEEIDKRLKGFLAQTKLFERSDSLKAELSESIEDIKTQIEKVSLQRKDLFEMENQMVRIRKLHEDSGDRLARFLAEKKKLEAMDGDFQKVVNLSQSMELRLQQVTSSHDTLQQIQFEIRKLEDYTKEMDTQLERLERKRQILDSTTEGVDRNFNLIQTIERTIKTLHSDSAQLPPQIEEMSRKIKTLLVSKGETEEAIQRAGKLGSILKDIEDRMVKMEKAREWLAGTETRLQEIGRQAEEQVKLLATLNKSGDAKGRGKDGAPPPDVRQVVLKLAHQGWAKGEIARVTKLSIGEIELILEMETAG